MKNRNVKVIDEHNIDRNAYIMFALELEGSEYVVYWIERDQDSNNVFVSKVLRNIDNTFNMLNIDDTDKKQEIAEIVKVLITSAVSDQNDKLVGTTTTLSNGKTVKFIDVNFNKEQNINVSKTYITTVKKEVTKVAEDYYDVVVEETKVAEVLPSVTPVAETVQDIFPQVEPVVSVSATPVSVPEPAVIPTPLEPVVTPSVVQPTPVVQVMEPVIVSTPVVEPAPFVTASSTVSAPESTVIPATVEPVVVPTVVEPTPVIPTPVPAAQIMNPEISVPTSQPLVFNASGETNLNAALGEVASTTAIPVENIEPVREFGVDVPVQQPVTQQPVIQSAPQTPITDNNNGNVGNAGFANNKFFMVVAIAFFLASCIFLGYEVYNYFQLVK